MTDKLKNASRRQMLKAGTLVGAGLAAPSLLLPSRSWAAGEPPLGTWQIGRASWLGKVFLYVVGR